MEMLTVRQQKKVDKYYKRYMRTRRGKKTPDLRIEDYLPILQKQANANLVMLIILIPIYIFALINIYSQLIANLGL